MPRPAQGLEPDETLVEHMTVAFRGSLLASIRGLALVSSRNRLKAFHAWAQVAEAAGFPSDKPEMVLGVTERRLMVWRPSFWFSRPSGVVGDVPIANVINAEVYRQGLAVVMAIGFTNGSYVEVESMRPRPMRRLRDAIRAQLATQ